jgi:hypothetical protein
MGVVRRTLGAVLLSTAAVVAAATPALADNGDRTQTLNCVPAAWQSPATGTAHARITSCKIEWGKNILDGSYWQTVTVVFLDTLTDGDCADLIVSNPSGSSPEQQECNSVPKTYTVTYEQHDAWIKVELSHGLKDKVSHTMTPPTGF